MKCPSGQTRTVIPLYLYGQSADMSAFQQMAEEHNLLIIEDAAQAHEMLYKEKKAGSWEDAAVFSFYSGKIWDALATVARSQQMTMS